ncbi:hypothetical protein ACFV6Y_38495 [Streptomyces massasporeus]|uniref:hypothetical protein n=1 Tax=Streptomyces massasporeus TaxID=67324 RepID=UPI00364A62AA
MPDIRTLINKLGTEESDAEHQAPEESTAEATPDSDRVPLNKAVFFALQGQGHIYAGTVPSEVIAQRRAKNRAARRARRGNTPAIRRAARLAESRNRSYRRLSRFVTGYMDHLGLIVDAEVVEDDQ